MCSMRAHLQQAHPGFIPESAWLEGHLLRACPGCGQAVVSLRSLCFLCRNPAPAGSPRADHLPRVPSRPRPAPVSLRSESKDLPFSATGGSAPPPLNPLLLSICSLTTPMLKYVPKRVAALFAHTWAGLLHGALESPLDPGMWFLFFIFPRVVLLAPRRGGRKVSRGSNLTDVVRSRVLDWVTRSASMIEDLLAMPTHAFSPSRASLERKVVAAVREGDVRKALQQFVAVPTAPVCEATFEQLKALHPAPSHPPPPCPPSLPPAPIFTDRDVRLALSSFPATSAAGLFGYRPALLSQCAHAESFSFLRSLTRFVNCLAAGSAPEFLRPFLAGGVSVALQKPNRGVRPLCCGDPIRRLVAKCFCIGGRAEISTTFAGRNFGVGCPGGVEVVAHSLRQVLSLKRGSGLALLKIDFKNAFNLIERSAFVPDVARMFPGLSRWTYWCYSSPSLLLYDHSRPFFSQSGVQQGDPLGPLYFCCGIASIVEAIESLAPVYNKWYMDDGGIVATPEVLSQVWEAINRFGPGIGIFLNPEKCEWSWLDPTRPDACPIDGVQLVRTDEVCILGVPLGSPSFSEAFVERELLSCEKVLEKLSAFEDSQVALYLLRLSYGVVRATHFMRTTPLSDWGPQAARFDELVRSAAESILCTRFTESAYVQACISPKLGGLGLRRVQDHAPSAYLASRAAAAVVLSRHYSSPFSAHATAPQSVSSAEIDEKSFRGLVSQADPRNAMRLRRLCLPHANSWVTAVPSLVDGPGTVLRPAVFRVAASRLLGLPVSSGIAPCPLCKQPMDCLGDHPLCCKMSRDVITRHNRVRNLLFRFASAGLLNPEMEKLGILGPTDPSLRRPGDVTIPLWSGGRGLAIDVAVINPLAHLGEVNPCEVYATTQKHKKYDAAFAASRYSFAPVVFETSGGVNAEGEDVVKQIFRFASARSGSRHSYFAGRAWARLSCCIQDAVAQTILNRCSADDEVVQADVDVFAPPAGESVR